MSEYGTKLSLDDLMANVQKWVIFNIHTKEVIRVVECPALMVMMSGCWANYYSFALAEDFDKIKGESK